MAAGDCQEALDAMRDTAVARKLADILHRMWIDGSAFNPGAGATMTPSMRATLKALRSV